MRDSHSHQSQELCKKDILVIDPNDNVIIETLTVKLHYFSMKVLGKDVLQDLVVHVVAFPDIAQNMIEVSPNEV